MFISAPFAPTVWVLTVEAKLMSKQVKSSIESNSIYNRVAYLIKHKLLKVRMGFIGAVSGKIILSNHTNYAYGICLSPRSAVFRAGISDS